MMYHTRPHYPTLRALHTIVKPSNLGCGPSWSKFAQPQTAALCQTQSVITHEQICVLLQVKAVSIEEDENGGADTDEKTNAGWILQNI